MSSRKFSSGVFACMLCLTSAALAFDGDRAGFLLGLGLGFGNAKQSVEVEDLGDISVSESGVTTQFRIGGGPTSQLMIYYQSQSIIFSQDYVVYDYTYDYYGSPALTTRTESGTFFQGFGGIGGSYFFAPMAPSPFASLALGMGSIMGPLDDLASDFGFGFQIGAGYEFAPSFVVEATYMRATVGSDEMDADITLDYKISNLMLTVSWLGY